MKHPLIKKLFVIGLAFLALAPVSLRAQSKSTAAATGSMAESSQRLEVLQRRLERLKSQLALDKEQLGDLSPATRRTLSRELDDLQEELDTLRVELASIRLQKEQVSATSNSAPSNCCQSTTAECCKKREEGATGSVCTTTVSGLKSCQAQITLIEPHPTTGTAIHLMNDQGQLRRGQNGFCIHFSGLRDSTPDIRKVQVDFTRDIGPIKRIRAIARLTQIEPGRYCGRVSLGMTGPWHITVKYVGPSGRVKAVLLAAVN